MRIEQVGGDHLLDVKKIILSGDFTQRNNLDAIRFTVRSMEENIFKIEESRIIEDPFEWNISFRPSKESGWLQWKIAKTEQEDSPGPIPPALAVHAKDILLLKDNAYE